MNIKKAIKVKTQAKLILIEWICELWDLASFCEMDQILICLFNQPSKKDPRWLHFAYKRGSANTGYPLLHTLIFFVIFISIMKTIKKYFYEVLYNPYICDELSKSNQTLTVLFDILHVNVQYKKVYKVMSVWY